jgi:UDP-N-acetyl-D-glucosamine dehydrogenase
MTATQPISAWEKKLAAKSLRVGVIGLGYVGLPLVHVFWQAGFPVTGFDIDSDKIEKLKSGESYIRHFPHQRIGSMVQSGRFAATDDFAELKNVDAILICVPTPLTATREPDLRFVVSTCDEIARHFREGVLVVLESTTWPGTTAEIVQPILERRGLKSGRDFWLAFSPEREDPGSAVETRTIPKIVGGVDEASGVLAKKFYEAAFAKVYPVRDASTAEAVKITENIFRAVNIALVNELKVAYSRMGINVWDVIDAAKTKPFGFMPFYPGPGLGGHCIPIDPFYLSWRARAFEVDTRFIELAGEVNTAMPAYVVSKVADALNDAGKPVKGSKVLILGMAYKKDVDDPRESPSFELLDLLLKKGARVAYNDPHVPMLPRMRHWPHLPPMESVKLTPESLAAQDCVLISTDHSAYDYDFIVKHAGLVIDTRNATKKVTANREKIVKA